MIVTRFAPSPTGPLHLGHAFSALSNFYYAQKHQGRFLLRIEDIDSTRARPHWETQIYDDLSWLGISWDPEVIRQSERHVLYRKALKVLWNKGLLYACTCKRRDIELAMSAPQEGVPTFGPDGVIYPGTCRDKNIIEEFSLQHSLRLNMRKAINALPETLSYIELDSTNTPKVYQFESKNLSKLLGDIIVCRFPLAASYHLCVVVDDADQGVSTVIRGQDLQEATKIHVVLQKILGFETPLYQHHRLIRDERGRRLAKRDDARALSTYREQGKTPQDIYELIK